MTLLEFILLAIVAAVCGSVGQALAGYSYGGCLVSAVVGFVGAYVGAWLARQFGLPELLPLTIGSQTFPIIWSIVGSAILSLILGLVSRRRRAFI
jgi:uncharacterized membrane protein YeaQ/YmgE (transglycosylase-associated protein family)